MKPKRKQEICTIVAEISLALKPEDQPLTDALCRSLSMSEIDAAHDQLRAEIQCQERIKKQTDRGNELVNRLTEKMTEELESSSDCFQTIKDFTRKLRQNRRQLTFALMMKL